MPFHTIFTQTTGEQIRVRCFYRIWILKTTLSVPGEWSGAPIPISIWCVWGRPSWQSLPIIGLVMHFKFVYGASELAHLETRMCIGNRLSLWFGLKSWGHICPEHVIFVIYDTPLSIIQYWSAPTIVHRERIQLNVWHWIPLFEQVIIVYMGRQNSSAQNILLFT